MIRPLPLAGWLNVCGGIYVFAALANQGWIPYMPGIVVGGYGFWPLCAGVAFYLCLLGVSAILLYKAARQLALRSRTADKRKLVASLVFMGVGIASLFAPSRAELSFWVWHDDFKAIAQSGKAGNVITQERPWRFGRTITTSDTPVSWSSGPLEQRSEPQHVLVFDYGHAVASLVFNSTDQAISHEGSGLCMTNTSEGGFIKRLEKNWFLCQRFGPQ